MRNSHLSQARISINQCGRDQETYGSALFAVMY